MLRDLRCLFAFWWRLMFAEWYIYYSYFFFQLKFFGAVAISSLLFNELFVFVDHNIIYIYCICIYLCQFQSIHFDIRYTDVISFLLFSCQSRPVQIWILAVIHLLFSFICEKVYLHQSRLNKFIIFN